VVALALFASFVLLLLALVAVRQPTVGALQRRFRSSADPKALERHVVTLSVQFSPRDVDHPRNLSLAADYVFDQLSKQSPRVQRQRYAIRGQPYENEMADFGPTTGRPLVIGAHYDSFGGFGANPGADDNASGVAALLELARLLRSAEVKAPVELVAFSTEEPPFFGSELMGSAVHARSLADAGRPPVVVICLEMLGYFTARQPWPSWLLRLTFPRRGDFVAVAGKWSDRVALRTMKRAMRGADGLPVEGFVGTADMLDASDQRSYWARGWPALLVTDTAFLRNPNYHSPTDTADSLDYGRMAEAVDGIANVALHADSFGQ
jgi:hypothetical protein